MAELQPPTLLETPPEIPYTEQEKNDIEDFFKGMTGRYKSRYKIGANGQLQIFSKENALLKTLQLKHFRPITTEERHAMDEARKEQLAALDVLFEKKRNSLREAIVNYKVTGAIEPVLIANQEVEDIELKRVLVRTAVRNVTTMAVPVTKEVLFDEPYEERKLFGAYNLFGKKDPLGEGIYRLERRSFPSSVFYGRYELQATQVSAEATGVVEESGKGRVRLETGSIARIFDEADDEHNGFLSPAWPTDFIFKDTKYSSAFQAYEGERMKELNEERVRTALLKTRSVRTIRTLTRKVTAAVRNPKKLWTDIFTSLYAQHSELAAKLDSTGTDILLYADPLGGVGLAREDRRILQPTNWPQENLVGTVLEIMRARLREKGPGELAAPVGGARESVITEEEQKNARVAAIIQARRRY